MDNLVIDREAGVYTFTEKGKSYIYPSVTEVLRLLRRLAGEWDAEEKDLLRGRCIHKATALMDGGLDGSGLNWETVDSSLYGYLHAWEKFKIDTQLRSVFVEHSVRSHKHRYAGTLDRVGTFKDKTRILLDLKTGSSVSIIEGPQLNAYAVALQETYSAARHPMIFYSLHLHEDGTYKLIEYPDRAGDFATFLSCLTLWNRRISCRTDVK